MANLIYQNAETAITWLASGGTNTFTLTSQGAGTGQQGAHYDFGVAAVAREFAWRGWVKLAGTPVVGEVIRIYWKTSDGTSPDNDEGTGDTDYSTREDKLRNLQYIGSIVVDEAVNTVLFVASGVLSVYHRYGAPVFWNATAANALSSTAGDHGFSLTPVPLEIQ